MSDNCSDYGCCDKPSDTTTEPPREAISPGLVNCYSPVLLGAVQKLAELESRFAKLATVGCTCGDGDCEAGDCYGCRGQMNLILRDELDEANAKLDLVTSNFHTLLNERFLENSELRQRAEAAEMRMKELLDALRLCKLYGSQGDIDDGRKGAVSVSYYVDKAIDAAEAALATIPPAAGELNR